MLAMMITMMMTMMMTMTLLTLLRDGHQIGAGSRDGLRPHHSVNCIDSR